MTMKLPRKLLSCLLVLAICITTVFGCLMTVSAAAASYAFGEGSVNEELTEAAINVTLTPPTDVATLANGTYMAEFMLNEVDTDGLVLQSVAVEAIAPNSIPLETIGLSYNSEDLADGEIAYIELDCNAAFTSVTLKLTFGFSGGTAVKGNEYKMSIDSVTYTGRYEGETYTETASATGVIKTGCDHIITVDEADLIKTDSVNGYSVYSKSLCSICGEEFDYQVVPTKTPGKVIYWSGDTEAEIADNGEDGSPENPIIIDNAEELAYIATVQTDAANATTGKYYKVADGIDAIVLQPKSDAAKAIMSLTTATQVKNYFENGNIADLKPWVSNGWKTASTVYPFAGNFDGNGVTIYGMYFSNPTNDGTYTGLFSYVAGDPKVENVTIANAYLVSAAHMGAVSSYLQTGNINGTYNKISLESCAVINSYMESHLMNYTAGVLTGSTGVYSATNCIVYGNDARNVAVPNTAEGGTGYELCMIAQSVGDNAIQNCVALGTIPYAKYCPSHGQWFNSDYGVPCVNVYTDQPTTNLKSYKYSNGEIIAYSTDVAKDTFCNALTSTTASQVKTQSFVDTLNANDGNADADVWQLDAKTGYPTFAKDVAEIEEEGSLLYYNTSYDATTDSAFMTETSGTKEDPYIIDTVTELRHLFDKVTYTDTIGKYFKIDDSIDTIVLQTKNNVDANGGLDALLNLSTPDEVEAYFTNATSKNEWYTFGYTEPFAGHFDGNGVTIIGMYTTSGFFGATAPNATIENITIKNSFVDSAWYAGALIGATCTYTSPTDNTTVTGSTTVSNCVVANCCVKVSAANDNYNDGIICGMSRGDAAIKISNSLVYGNSTVHTNTSTLVTTKRDSVVGNIRNVNPDGDEEKNGIDNQFTNSIFLDCVASYKSSRNATKSGNFENVYTNKSIDEFKSEYDAAANYAEKVFVISEEDIQGLKASSVVTALNTANGGATVWAATANGYPTPMAAYADTINSVSSIDLALKAVNLTYNNDGSFNLNFHYEPAYSGFEPQLYVAQADLSGFIKLEAKESSMANNGLSADALMYVIENLSAREIGDTLLPTVVAANGNQALWGKTEQMSIADYAVAVINGEGYYTDTTDETIIQQDKNVAAAVINYGNAAKAALSQGYDGNAAGGVTWTYDGTPATAFSNPVGTGTADSPIIINSAKELAYLAQGADGNTAGKYYKIADGVSNIVLQKADYADEVMALGTTTEVEEYFNPTYATKTGTQLGAKNTALSQWATSTTARDKRFAGTFDGNGATIYGMYSYQNSSNGLFPNTGNVTVKNITIKNSYIYGDKVGFICGVASECGTVALENCSLYNNVGRVYRRNDSISAGGVLIGSNAGWGLVKDANNVAVGGEGYIETYGNNYANCFLNVNNCLIYGNSVRHQGWYDSGTEYDIDYSIFGGASGGVTVANSIILDNAPYSISYGWNQFYNASFTNVYTNMVGDTVTYIDYQSNGTSKIKYEITTTFEDDGISIDPVIKKYTNDTLSNTYTKTDYGTATTGLKKVTAAQVLGSAAATNCPNLDWTNTWVYGMSGEYPTPVTSATTETAGETWYWSGNTDAALADSGETGDSWDNAIIIDSAEELAYICTKINPTASCDKYYKIKDGVDSIVLQASTYGDAIKSLESADKVQDYFENVIGESNRLNWMNNRGGVFNGNFDGNGATVYGLFAQATSAGYYCGLFQGVDGGSLGDFTDSNSDGMCGGTGEVNNDADGKELSAVVDNDGIIIKNITVKNSYFDASPSTNNNRRVGAIVAECYSQNWGAHCAGTVNLDSCGVINCYLTTNTTSFSSGGVMFGNSSNEIIKINNALVYGNNAYNTAIQIHDGTTGFELPMVGGMPGSDATTGRINAMTNSLVLGTTPYHQHNFGYATYHNNKYFDNVYTDKDVPGVNYYYSTSNGWVIASGVTHSGLSQVNLSDMLGDKAADVVKAINDANGDSRDMYVGNAWGYPSFEKAGVMPTANQMAYDALTMTNYDEYTHTDPYFSMYATSLNLKTNPYIAFTFAFAGGTPDYKANRDNITVTFKTASETITTTVGNGNGGLSDGWTNNEGAGRYHLYRLTGISVEDLCKDITVTVNYSDTDYTFGTFSAEGFALDIQNAYKQDPCQYYATRVEAAKALLYYTQMINARYGSIA